jgi:hypothetical protein
MARGGVEPPIAESEHLRRFRDLHAGRQHARAAQHGANPRQQFAHGEGLGQIVVRAHFEADDTVGLLVARREHQHRHRAELARAQFAAQHEAVLARHHEVEHDQIGRAALQHGAHLPAVGGQRNAHAVLLQIAREQFADAAIVVDDQHVVGGFHRQLIASCVSSAPGSH